MPSDPGSSPLIMHDHAGTVIGGVQLRIRPHAPSARNRAKGGSSTSQRSTSVGSRQSRPMMQVFKAWRVSPKREVGGRESYRYILLRRRRCEARKKTCHPEEPQNA